MAFDPNTAQQNISDLQDLIRTAETEVQRLNGLIGQKNTEINNAWKTTSIGSFCTSTIWGSGTNNTCNPTFVTSLASCKTSSGWVDKTKVDGIISAYASAGQTLYVLVAKNFSNYVNGLCQARDTMAAQIGELKTNINAYGIELANLTKAYNDFIKNTGDAAANVIGAQANADLKAGISDFFSNYGVYIVVGIVVIAVAYFYFKKRG